jgi:predicted nucleic acid-binding protein
LCFQIESFAMLVVDSSVFLAASMPDEQSELAGDILDLGRLSRIIVPIHFHIEVGNALTMNVRRRRIDQAIRTAILFSLADMNCDIETPELIRATQLADQFGLTLYDSAYLEVSERLQTVVSTFDRKLAAAAASLGLLHPAIASAGLWA